MSQVVVDIFGDIVAKVSAAVTPALQLFNPAIVGVNYLYGVPLEIIKVLTQWTASETYEPLKYPLVALFQPFDEVMGNNKGLAEEINVRVIIAGLTLAEWSTPDRYLNNFKPILYPIYDELMKQIFTNPLILSLPNQVKHTKIDWPFWDDGTGKNPFNDKLDVVEIKNMKLNIQPPSGC